jgi:LysM repeat protein
VEEGSKARRVLALLVAGEAIAVVALHRLGGVEGFAIPRHDLVRWLQQSPSEDVLLAGVRLAALVSAWWLLGSTLLYVAARAARFHGTAAALGWATLPAVRRWADRAAAVSIVAATALGVGRPAAADPPPTSTATAAPVVIEADHRDPASVPSRLPSSVRTGQGVDPPPAPSVPSVETAPVPAPPPTTASLVPSAEQSSVVPVVPAVPAAPPRAPSAGATHTVTRGEHLWSIAAGQVATATGKQPTDLAPDDVAPYWLRVVEINRPRLHSGNANLVYPGEIVELPPL